MRILTVVGARPQFVKAAVVSRALRRHAGIVESLVHTGQHYDAAMSDIFFDELAIPRPTHHLDVGSGGHGEQTGRMLERLERVMREERPDWVLVYGDTNSTLAGALAAAKLQIPVAHVEAGLRSFNRAMPEELNRVLTDHASDRLFAPTAAAVAQLAAEGIPADRVLLTGDVMYDATCFYAARAASGLAMPSGDFVLATIHRNYNTDDPVRLRAIVHGLARVARQMPVIFPVHPRTRKAIALDDGMGALPSTLTLVDPVGYLEMIALERRATVIATDSGGVQKEAYFFRVPCVTLRDETEWMELVQTGWNRLCRTDDAGTIAATVLGAVRSQGEDVQLYGAGDAGDRIAAWFADHAATTATVAIR